MDCIIKKPPRCFKDLSYAEQMKIEQFIRDCAEDATKQLLAEAMVEDEIKLQKIWLKMACIALHNNCEADEEMCLAFLVAWKRLYHRTAKFNSEPEQTAWLERELAKIFPNGYPDAWVESLDGRRKEV